MHNFAKPAKLVADSLKDVGKSLRSQKKDFFESNKSTLEVLFNHYDTLAIRDELHTLGKQWAIKAGDDDDTKLQKQEKRHLASQLYGDDRPFVNKHWEYLKEKNDGRTLYCPMCGLHECEEMDHYLPRGEQEYPEYSAHLSNLIPLCHKCNHKKSSKFLDANGNRLYFNAFYDLLMQRDILSCTISINPTDGLPQIATSISPSLSSSKKPDMYVISTIGDLELMARFESKAKEWLRYEMSRLSLRAGQSWNEIKKEMAAMASPVADDSDIVHPAVLKAISESKEMETWFNGLIVGNT